MKTTTELTAYEQDYSDAYRDARHAAYNARVELNRCYANGLWAEVAKARLVGRNTEVAALETTMPKSLRPHFGITV